MDRGDQGKEIEIDAITSVAELAPRIAVSNRQLVTTAFHELGLLLTIYENLSFEQAQELVSHFGYVARRRAS